MSEPFDAGRYRRQNQTRGVVLRWWRALPCECVDPRSGEADAECTLCEADGRRYVEQFPISAFDGQPSRALVYQTQVEQQDAEWGPIKVGSTAISVMPDEMPITRLDRVVVPSLREARCDTVTRGAGADDALPFAPVAAVSRVEQNGVAFAATAWSLTLGNTLHWTGIARPAPGTRVTVFCEVNPVFVALDAGGHPRPSGSGGPLPRELVLTLAPRDPEARLQARLQ